MSLKTLVKKGTDVINNTFFVDDNICPRYPGNPTRTESMCSARHRKALSDPERLTYQNCADCDIGKKAAQGHENKSAINYKQTTKQTSTNTHLCPQCGKPTRGKLCAGCMLKKKMGSLYSPAREARMQDHKKCNVEGCNNLSLARGRCNKHYKQAVKSREITTKPIKPRNKTTDNNMNYRKDNRFLTASMAQLLYCSQVLDKEISNAISLGKIEVENISDIRFRLGEIMREAI